MARQFSDREKQRLTILCDTFRKIDRILTGDSNIMVRTARDGESPIQGINNIPGWSSYPEIVVNASAFDNFKDSKTVVQLLGLNYHELSHIMFSPPAQWKACYLKTARHNLAYMLLEDQRIESLFTARYKPAGKYFTEMVIRFYVDDKASWESAFLVTYGRSYLPLEIREEFEARYRDPVKIDLAKDLINRYKSFRAYHFRSKTAVVLGVLEEFGELLEQEKDENPDFTPEEDSACGDSHENSESHVDEELEKEAQQEEKKQREKEERTGEDQSGFWEEDDEEDSESDDDESASGEGDDEPDGEDDSDPTAGEDGEDSEDSESGDSDGSDSEGDSDGDDESQENGDGDGDADSDGDSESDDGEDGDSGVGESDEGDEDSSGESAGGESEFESAFEDGELADYLEEITNAVKQDDAVQNEIRNILAAVNDDNIVPFAEKDWTATDHEPANPVLAASVVKSQQQLRRLYAEVEPGWNWGSDQGKLNMGRFLDDPENFDEMFDEWDEGREDEVGLEVVVGVDLSGSMGGSHQYNPDTGMSEYVEFMKPTSEALYIIKRALDDVEAMTTVIGFGMDEVVSMYRREERVGVEVPYFRDTGSGTIVAPALHYARRVMQASKMPNKLFVIITDGEWHLMDPEDDSVGGWGDEAKEHIISLINQIDCTRMYFGIGDDSDNGPEIQGAFDVVQNNIAPAMVPDLVQRAVLAILDKRRR